MSTQPLLKKKWNYDDIGDQTGKIFLVTGANSGLGFSASRGLASHGATVIITSRSLEKGIEASNKIKKKFPDAKLDVMELDLASFKSIKELATNFKSKYSQLNGLLNNAGVMQPPFRKTEDGLELQMGTNHFGHFLLTGLLLDIIKNTPNSRVIMQSSFAHEITNGINFEDINNEKNYSRTGVYSQSKLANLLFAFELNRKFQEHNIKSISLAVHPGYSSTNLQLTGPALGGASLFSRVYKVTNAVFAQSVDRGALPLIYASVASDVHGGDYIGPNGMKSMRGYPKRLKAKKTAYDKESAQKLWKISEEKTGLVYSF
jgi:NAD(P)-dependent dehydrogenase (short-subunit alcohol dehydrogenase family)